MNYIKQLEAENARLVQRQVKLGAQLTEFVRFLNYCKSIDLKSGKQKDCINIKDVLSWLAPIRNDFS